MPFLDYLIIALFGGIIFFVGFAFAKSGSNVKSFFAAGGSLPWWLSGLSLFMSFFSAGTFVVWGSIAYELGWVAITIQWMMGISGLLIGAFIAGRWRKTGVLTVAEYVGQKFGPGLRQFYSYVFLLLSFVTTGAFLYPVAKIFNVSTGFSIEASIIGLGLLVIAYTAAGGLWAVVITDVLQFVILFAAVLIVVPLSLHEVGGVDNFLAQVPDGFLNLVSEEYSIWFLAAFLFYNTIFIGGNWAYVQRYTSVATPSDAKKAAWLFAALYTVSPVLWMLPPMIYRVLNPELVDLENEGAFLLMCKTVLPTGLLGLMLAGMIFATASSVNTTLNMMAAVFTNDLYSKFAGSGGRLSTMNIAKLSTILFGIVSIVVALLVPAAGGIVDFVISVGAITGAPLFAPTIWALFSRRQTTLSVLIVTIGSLLINIFFKFIAPVAFGISLDTAQEMMVGVFIPLILLALFEVLPIGVVRAYKSPAIDLESASDQTENSYALRILSYALMLIGTLIFVLSFGAKVGMSWILIIGISVIIIGLAIYRWARIPKQTQMP